MSIELTKNPRCIDLTHTLALGIPHWGNTCGFQNEIKLDYSDCAADTKFRVQHMSMPAGIGTHLDAPAHCIPGARSVDDIPLSTLIAPYRVIDVSDRMSPSYSITDEDVQRFENQYGEIPNGAFVIFFTGWEKYWSQPEQYRNNLIFPSLSEEAARTLLARQVVGIGIDTLSPDAGDSDFPVHRLLLGADKYIIENIANAKSLGALGGYVIALPIKIQGGTEAPIRLIALLE